MSILSIMASVVTCYVGSNTGAPDGQSLSVLECDVETGAAKVVQTVTNVQGTTYFQLDASGRFLYSVIGEKASSGGRGCVVRFPVGGDGRLGPVERLATLPCEAPCHVALTGDGRRVAFAAYLSGTAGTVGVDGTGLKTFVFPNDAMGPNKKRQQKAYAHQTFNLPDGKLGVVDLGCDRIWFFDPATMQRVPDFEIKAKPGDGPRHALLSKNGKFLFVLNELSSTVTTYAYNSSPSSSSSPSPLAFASQVSMLPADYNRWEPDGETLATKAAAIKLTADGKILMASNRGHDSIAFYAVDEQTGKLTLRNIAKLTGKFPRDFALLPGEKFLIVGHKMSNEVQVYRFDRSSCTLEPAGAPLPLWRPLCFVTDR